MRYISFSEKTMAITDKCVVTAEEIWGKCRYPDVRFMAGFSGYGKALATYDPASKIVYVSINRTFKKLRITKGGLDVVDEHGYTGTILHELGHHASGYAPKKYPDCDADTHKTPAWIWVCVTGWEYFFPGNGLTVDRILRSMRRDSENVVGHYLSKFHPNDDPVEFVETVGMFLANDKDNDLPDGMARCLHCGTKFRYQRRTAKYCSAKCRVAASRVKTDTLTGKN